MHLRSPGERHAVGQLPSLVAAVAAAAAGSPFPAAAPAVYPRAAPNLLADRASMSLTFRRVGRSPSSATLALSEWQEKEARNQLQSAVDEDGSLLDNLTLELRVHPPSIEIDNHAHEKWTVVTIDSANRPGSLIYVRAGAAAAAVAGRCRTASCVRAETETVLHAWRQPWAAVAGITSALHPTMHPKGSVVLGSTRSRHPPPGARSRSADCATLYRAGPAHLQRAGILGRRLVRGR